MTTISEPRPRVWGYLAGAWCACFAVLHLYWALGGTVGLASSAGTDLAARRPLSFVLGGLWGVALLLVAGAAFSVALARWRPRGGLRRAVVVVGYLGGALLLARGLLLEAVLLTGAGGVTSAVGPVEARSSLILWNPWFILGGLALLVACRRFARG